MLEENILKLKRTKPNTEGKQLGHSHDEKKECML